MQSRSVGGQRPTNKLKLKLTRGHHPPLIERLPALSLLEAHLLTALRMQSRSSRSVGRSVGRLVGLLLAQSHASSSSVSGYNIDSGSKTEVFFIAAIQSHPIWKAPFRRTRTTQCSSISELRAAAEQRSQPHFQPMFTRQLYIRASRARARHDSHLALAHVQQRTTIELVRSRGQNVQNFR